MWAIAILGAVLSAANGASSVSGFVTGPQGDPLPDARVFLEKGLSGGERKRVSIARELIFDPHILFLDEPTSGLSSKDSEEIICFLRNLVDMGKLVFVVVHQPGSKIYKLFDKIVLLDIGGKLVYTGPVLDCIHYMKEVANDTLPAECPQCKTSQPELIFEILEERDEKD